MHGPLVAVLGGAPCQCRNAGVVEQDVQRRHFGEDSLAEPLDGAVVLEFQLKCVDGCVGVCFGDGGVAA